MSEPKTLTLKTPIAFGKVEITELTFREPLAGDMRGLPLGEHNIGHMLNLGSVLCAQPPAVLDKLGLADLAEVLGIVGGFIQAGLGTPTTL